MSRRLETRLRTLEKAAGLSGRQVVVFVREYEGKDNPPLDVAMEAELERRGETVGPRDELIVFHTIFEKKPHEWPR